MLPISSLLFLLIISSSIIQTFSAVMWELEKSDNDIEAALVNRKAQNFHRGVLFTLSDDVKNKFCRDLYHSQLYDEGSGSSEEDESKIPGSFEDVPETLEKISTVEKVAGEPSQKEPSQDTVKKVTSYTSATIQASQEVPKITAEGSDKTADVGEKGEPGMEESDEDDEPDIIVTDGMTDEDSPQHPLMVKELATDELVLVEQELFFSCSILNSGSSKPKEDLYLFSTAFLSGWFYISTLATQSQEQATLKHEKDEPSHDQATQSHDQEILSPDQEKLTREQERLRRAQEILSEKQAMISHYLAISPPEISKTNELEARYGAVRDTLEILRAESPAYIKLVTGKNDLKGLNAFKRKLACASVLSSPIYQEERLEASKNFDDDKDSLFDETEPRHVAFNDISYDHKGYSASCIPCYGYESYDEYPTVDTELCLIPSFNNRDSLFVLKEEFRGENRWLLSKYFEKVSVLTHARKPVDETDVFVL